MTPVFQWARGPAGQTSHSRRTAESVFNAYDFARFAEVEDVGGGQGAFLAAILTKHLSMRGVLFDQPQVVAGADQVLRTAGVADRCQVVGGDFFEAVPDGAGAYVLKSVLHNWGDEQARAVPARPRLRGARGGPRRRWDRSLHFHPGAGARLTR